MSKLTRLYLGLGLGFLVVGILFATDVLDPGDVPAFYVTLPLGAVFLGLFAICYMLDKESERYDAEHRRPEVKTERENGTAASLHLARS